MTKLTNTKDFGMALLLWFIGGLIGAHRIYTTEKTWLILIYWLGTICTLGLLPLIELFLLRSIVRSANYVKAD